MHSAMLVNFKKYEISDAHHVSASSDTRVRDLFMTAAGFWSECMYISRWCALNVLHTTYGKLQFNSDAARYKNNIVEEDS